MTNGLNKYFQVLAGATSNLNAMQTSYVNLEDTIQSSVSDIAILVLETPLLTNKYNVRPLPLADERIPGIKSCKLRLMYFENIRIKSDIAKGKHCIAYGWDADYQVCGAYQKVQRHQYVRYLQEGRAERGWAPQITAKYIDKEGLMPYNYSLVRSHTVGAEIFRGSL